MQEFTYATFGCMDLAYSLIEMKAESVMLPWWYEPWEAPTRHVHARFRSDIFDEADVTCTSIATFVFAIDF